jgi:hypothetical protein
MRKSLGFVKLVFSLGLAAVIVVSTMALIGAPPAMARPAPDCGPVFSWDCTMPNGTHQYIEGTRCDISAFQKKTGARCVIGGGL